MPEVLSEDPNPVRILKSALSGRKGKHMMPGKNRCQSVQPQFLRVASVCLPERCFPSFVWRWTCGSTDEASAFPGISSDCCGSSCLQKLLLQLPRVRPGFLWTGHKLSVRCEGTKCALNAALKRKKIKAHVGLFWTDLVHYTFFGEWQRKFNHRKDRLLSSDFIPSLSFVSAFIDPCSH